MLKILAVGDLVLDEPDADGFFDLARETLLGADLLIGHVEVPHTRRGVESRGDVPAPGADPENLKALGRAGFNVATLAGNHIHDRGPEGIADTIAGLTAQGIAVCGAGADLASARAPAIVARGGVRVGVLSYNCVGPKMGWAGERSAGCAYVHVLTHYELDMASPGGPPKTYTFADPDSLEALQGDIQAARQACDVVVVMLHKGLVHMPAVLAMYERPVARAAVDAGADIVLGCHAHILRGIEIYRGKPIFHGLGNFVTVTGALTEKGNESPERRAWARKRQEVFGFTPDPDYPLYPFHPEAKNAMIAACTVGRDGAIDAGFLPCYMRPSAQPEPLRRGPQAEAVAAYIADITQRAGLATRFSWDGDRVACRAV
ncbi:MAG: CapA family protein [Hyphomonadaceae bacterium]|nr:CapA family protein [Hyphomonadaceae bacterium]